jgi:pilus assembly protein Flp/PilA
LKIILAFLKNESGATAIEYGLIAACISVAIIAVVQGVGTKSPDFTQVKNVEITKIRTNGQRSPVLRGFLFEFISANHRARKFSPNPQPQVLHWLGLRCAASLIAQGLGVAWNPGVCCVRRSRPPSP